MTIRSPTRAYMMRPFPRPACLAHDSAPNAPREEAEVPISNSSTGPVGPLFVCDPDNGRRSIMSEGHGRDRIRAAGCQALAKGAKRRGAGPKAGSRTALAPDAKILVRPLRRSVRA